MRGIPTVYLCGKRNGRCKLGPNCPFQNSRTLKLPREASLERFWPIALCVNVCYRSCYWYHSINCNRVLQSAATPLSATVCWCCVILSFCGFTVRVLTGSYCVILSFCRFTVRVLTATYCVVLSFCEFTVRVLTGTYCVILSL
jgi:hypothetical protein